MNSTIWKFKPGDSNDQHCPVSMPTGAKMLSVGVQNGEILVWALVDPTAPPEERRVSMYGTGWEDTTPNGPFLGTVFVDRFVFHCFADGK